MPLATERSPNFSISFFLSLRHMITTSMIAANRYTYSSSISGSDSIGAKNVTTIERMRMPNATGMKNSPRLNRAST